ncbi:MAG: translation elongation factor Ts [Bacilli bacterium]|nr:translation elongation factor Ts [Bacilli bacterium]
MDKEFLKKVQELKKLTQVGYNICIEALKKNNNDIEKSIEWLRIQGIVKATSREHRKAKEGIVKCFCEENTAVIFEINCETSFVAKNDLFCELANNFAKECLKNKNITNFEQAEKIFAQMSALLLMSIKEKIVLKRFEKISKKENECFGFYNHMGNTACVVILEKNNPELAKEMAVHITANDTRYINFENVEKTFIDKEKKIALETIKNDKKLANKPKKLINDIINMKIHKNIDPFVLNEQKFVYNEEEKVSCYLEKNKNKVVNFFKYTIK